MQNIIRRLVFCHIKKLEGLSLKIPYVKLMSLFMQVLGALPEIFWTRAGLIWPPTPFLPKQTRHVIYRKLTSVASLVERGGHSVETYRGMSSMGRASLRIVTRRRSKTGIQVSCFDSRHLEHLISIESLNFCQHGVQ